MNLAHCKPTVVVLLGLALCYLAMSINIEGHMCRHQVLSLTTAQFCLKNVGFSIDRVTCATFVFGDPDVYLLRTCLLQKEMPQGNTEPLTACRVASTASQISHP